MKSQKIKQLAIIAAQTDSVPSDIQDFVLTRLTKKELKEFLKKYKIELDKNRVLITTASELTQSELEEFKKMFENKKITTTVEKSLGAGVTIKQNDMIFDFSMHSLIEGTISRLKN